MAAPKIYIGTQWYDFVMKARLTSSWADVAKYWTGSAWEPLVPSGPLSVVAENVYANVASFQPSGRVPATGYAYTNTVVSNGVGPFTYLWEKMTDADGSDFIISSTTAQNPGWYGTRSGLHTDNIETWRVTVTDTGDSNNTAQDTINVDLEWINLS